MPHLKRYQMPRSWKLPLKQETFVIHPRGAHPKLEGIPLRVALRDLLGLGQTAKEVASILNQGMILVDKKVRKDPAFALGLMDVLEIPQAGKAFTVEVARNGLLLKETAATDRKLCRVIGKSTVKGGKEQIQLHDGRTIPGEKSPFKPGDSLLIQLPDQKILSHLPLREGSEALVFRGKNRGSRGVIISLRARKFMTEKATAVLEAEGKKIETLKDYLFVVKAEKEKK